MRAPRKRSALYALALVVLAAFVLLWLLLVRTAVPTELTLPIANPSLATVTNPKPLVASDKPVQREIAESLVESGPSAADDEAGGFLFGHVVDAKGKPKSGVELVAFPEGFQLCSDSELFDAQRWSPTPLDLVHDIARARSGIDGQFMIDGLHRGRWMLFELEELREGYTPLPRRMYASGTSNIEFVHGEHWLEVTVDGLAPDEAPGGWMYLREKEQEWPWLSGERQERRNTSAASFRVGAGRTYTFGWISDAHVSVEQGQFIRADSWKLPCTLTLKPAVVAANLEIVLREPDGGPVTTNMNVRLESPLGGAVVWEGQVLGSRTITVGPGPYRLFEGSGSVWPWSRSMEEDYGSRTWATELRELTLYSDATPTIAITRVHGATFDLDLSATGPCGLAEFDALLALPLEGRASRGASILNSSARYRAPRAWIADASKTPFRDLPAHLRLSASGSGPQIAGVNYAACPTSDRVLPGLVFRGTQRLPPGNYSLYIATWSPPDPSVSGSRVSDMGPSNLLFQGFSLREGETHLVDPRPPEPRLPGGGRR